jgi:hypothetical protein
LQQTSIYEFFFRHKHTNMDYVSMEKSRKIKRENGKVKRSSQQLYNTSDFFFIFYRIIKTMNTSDMETFVDNKFILHRTKFSIILVLEILALLLSIIIFIFFLQASHCSASSTKSFTTASACSELHTVSRRCSP